jgi:hypothetical protein
MIHIDKNGWNSRDSLGKLVRLLILTRKPCGFRRTVVHNPYSVSSNLITATKNIFINCIDNNNCICYNVVTKKVKGDYNNETNTSRSNKNN